MKTAYLLTSALAIVSAGEVNASGAVVFGGIDAAEASTFGHIGGVWAMNGDLAKSGILMRGMLSYGGYDYDTTAVAGGNVDGDALGAELGVGYQWVNPGSRVSMYGSLDYQDHDLSPNDPANSVRGSETGGLVQGEIESLGAPWYGSLIGKYSSAYDSYWVRGRGGYAWNSMTVGAEAILGGNEEYDETRFGLFLKWPFAKDVSLSASVGHREAEGDGARNDESGAYFSLGVTAGF